MPVRDSEALAGALLSLISDDGRRRAYGEKGMERAKDLYSVAAVMSKTVGIYKELLNHE